MKSGALMIQGTTSDAGKSIMVSGLCRVLARRGISVAPFKPQNMSLNSAVTPEGGEIGRAQALQAQAARVSPHTDMNPVLLKPSADTTAQVIIHGKACQSMDARDYHQYKQLAMSAVMDSWQRLTEQHAWVLVEGAGSPAEINLRDRDIANMGFAEAADVPVIIVADIDRGGVFAHLTGTLDLLSESEQNRVIGFIINRFRGDISLLQPGIDWLEQRTGKPVLGVVPYLHNLQLDAEDAIDNEQPVSTEQPLRVVVPVLPRISNHTDFDVLRLHPQVKLEYVGEGQAIPPADLIILPGSKNVRADLAWLRDNGWEQALERHLRYGGKLLGICAGLQMLGNAIEDPDGIEDIAGSAQGLGWLRLDTRLEPEKTLALTQGELTAAIAGAEPAKVTGYEIHCGVSSHADSLAPLIILDDGRAEGALSADGQIAGTYLHGLFDEPAGCSALLHWAGLDAPEDMDRDALRERELERLADCLEASLALDVLFPDGCTA